MSFATDIDLADNELGKVPDTLLKVSSLKRLNLSGNKLLELPSGIGECQFILLAMDTVP